MRIITSFLLCLFSLAGFSSGGQPTKRHLFVEWRHRDSVIVLGEFTGRKFKRKNSRYFPIGKLKSADVSTWLGEDGNDETLLYFHAMWGQQVNFQRKCLRSIEKILDNQGEDGIQTVISFIWHAGGLLYPRNWNRAFVKGEPLGELIGWIGAHYDNKLNFLGHSMGHRVFEGALSTAIEPDGTSVHFGTAILFSPDLDIDVDDPDFIRLYESATQVVVFKHRRDLLLLISSWLLGRERLGRSGPKGDTAALSTLSRLTVVDMTDHVKGIQNHTHLDKEWVQRRIREELSP